MLKILASIVIFFITSMHVECIAKLFRYYAWHSLFVHKDYQGKDVATALVSERERHARQKNVKFEGLEHARI